MRQADAEPLLCDRDGTAGFQVFRRTVVGFLALKRSSGPREGATQPSSALSLPVSDGRPGEGSASRGLRLAGAAGPARPWAVIRWSACSGGMAAAVVLLCLLAGHLQGEPLFRMEGGRISGRLGTAVCVLGDVDEDGVSDMAVGSPTSGGELCFVAVHSGTDGNEIWRTDGVLFQDKLGTSLAAVGDLDADGYPDLIASYPTDWGAVDSFNRAWVLSGRDGAMLLEILGGKKPEGFAAAVAPAGDLDGDAVPDVWIGSAFGPDAARLGRVTAFSGKSGLEIRHIDAPEGQMFRRCSRWAIPTLTGSTTLPWVAGARRPDCSLSPAEPGDPSQRNDRCFQRVPLSLGRQQ